jgi:pimeloyl-ACP methyl ester carboxylesterase
MRKQQKKNEGWTRFDYRSSDGLRLAGRKYGWQHLDTMPVVCLPGLTRNSADFHELALFLANAPILPRRVLCLDYRGRGMSQYDRRWRNYNILNEAEDVANGMTAAGLEHAAIIGTSRGGLISFVLAAMRPTILRAVVLNDIGPEINSQGLVRIKNYVGKTPTIKNWDQAAEAVRAIGKSQFPHWDNEKWEKQARLIFEEKNGRIVSRYDPRLVKSLGSLDLDNPLPSMWPQFTGLTKIPVLTIRGRNSDILTESTLHKMHETHPKMQSMQIDGQGHAPDLCGVEVCERLSDFLLEID